MDEHIPNLISEVPVAEFAENVLRIITKITPCQAKLIRVLDDGDGFVKLVDDNLNDLQKTKDPEVVHFSRDSVDYCFTNSETKLGYINGVLFCRPPASNLSIHQFGNNWSYLANNEFYFRNGIYAHDVARIFAIAGDYSRNVWQDLSGDLFINHRRIAKAFISHTAINDILCKISLACMRADNGHPIVYLDAQTLIEYPGTHQIAAEGFAVSSAHDHSLVGLTKGGCDATPFSELLIMKDDSVVYQIEKQNSDDLEIFLDAAGRHWAVIYSIANGSKELVVDGAIVDYSSSISDFQFLNPDDGDFVYATGHIECFDDSEWVPSNASHRQCLIKMITEGNRLILKAPGFCLGSLAIFSGTRRCAWFAKNDNGDMSLFLDGLEIFSSEMLIGNENDQLGPPVFSENGSTIRFYSVRDGIISFILHSTK